ncbi:hypothetical protein M404DRAFT_24349 [Pisolithus tinctorius Marx 270]|uniref:Uncharacterized protein n=1 Tax=Pisolithus tinctorius Marx 270 TaxID=870435 RepID=A0A0C3P0K6_PISTI|nr:hypothetical protein M404DRAFT_24349 [Pisolithus tinctorius Marx 270]
MTTTVSNLAEPIPCERTSNNEPDQTSTPLMDTLPSTSTSVSTDVTSPRQTVASQLQDSFPPQQNNMLQPSTVMTSTIGALGPAPEPCSFNINRVSTCPAQLLNRILPTATWGTTDPYEDCSKVLCNPSSNEPINIWILSHITSTWFMKNGAPDNQCSVTILTLSSKLGQYTNHLLSEFSSPKLPINEFDHGLRQAIQWQSPRNRGATVLFSSIYDAWEILKSKSAMTKLDISHLQKHALVLLETHLNCYHQKDENGRWTISKAQFELEAVYLLQDPYLLDPEQNNDSGVEITGLAI